MAQVSAVNPSTPPLNQGETVFLGELDLNLDNVLTYNTVRYNHVAFNVSSSVPPIITTFSTVPGTPEDITTTAHPELTGARTGSWFLWDANRDDYVRDPTNVPVTAFILADPIFTIRVLDGTVGSPCYGNDRTGTIVMYPQDLNFRVDLNPDVVNRGGITFDIDLEGNGIQYPCVNAPCNAGGLGLIDIPFVRSPQWIGFWNTDALDNAGQFFTPEGTYSFNGMCIINGLTITTQTNTVTLARPQVEVTVAPTTIQRGNQAVVTISGQPDTNYYFGIIECPLRMTGEVCDRPPWIVQGSEINGTFFAMTGNEPLVPNCCGGLPFRSAVPPQLPPVPPGPYFIGITTDCTGVGKFLIDSDANVGKLIPPSEYTLHVQKAVPEPDGTTLFAQTTFTVATGDISIWFHDVSDPGKTPITEAFLGDFIGIEGINTDSGVTYLYMTGPCQPECGGSLFPDDPPGSYPLGLLGPGPDIVNVIGGNWVLVNPAGDPWWDTSLLPINPGTYTIYALSDWPTGCPNCVTCGGGTCELLDCPNCLVYDVGTITLKKPELSATVVDIERCCCPGFPCGITNDTHPIWVEGISTGNTPYIDWTTGALTKDVNVWLFGKGKIEDEKFLNWREPVPCDGHFRFSIPWIFPRSPVPTNTDRWNMTLCTIDAGTYDLVIQTKGYNQEYDVIYEDDINSAAFGFPVPVERNKRWIVTSYPSHDFIDQFLNPGEDYVKLVQVEGPGYKLGTEVLRALLRGLDDPNIDDQFIHLQFTVTDEPCLGGTNFEADRTYGNLPMSVRFTDLTSGGSSWLWDFGDGTTSTEKNPIHVYESEGRYTVSLTVDDDDAGKAVKNDYIRVARGPLSKFTYTPDAVTAGIPVQFVDLSTGNPTGWLYTFGDGGTSSLQSPVYTYAKPGVYTVTLTTSDENGVSESATEIITVLGSATPVKAEFKTEVTGGTHVQFYDLSTGFGIISWNWDFGDGTGSIEQSPPHTYLKEGTYQVSLTVSNGDYSNTKTTTIGIR
ncbi:MAG: PKD domain-containing protein [Methanospirillaceae archaeon]|nr:PKD domain-containing protein [Methanospirillaceae archaeon]